VRERVLASRMMDVPVESHIGLLVLLVSSLDWSVVVGVVT
jgi:hypothetical protein